MVKVGINGYGTIGKRIADAVKLQDDMELIGATKTRPSYEARMAVEHGIPLYAAKDAEVFEAAGIKMEGTLDDLLAQVDIVVDCTPGGVGAQYRDVYKGAGVKAIFQGGEDHVTAGISFNAMANYRDAYGADLVRVVSCNTTGLIRTLYPLTQAFGVDNVFASLIRRSVDPPASKGSGVNFIEPSLKLPTHHGPDVKTVLSDISIQTMAVKVPTTLMHVHCINVKLSRPATKDEVLEVWSRTPRVRFVRGGDGVRSSAQIMDMARDLGTRRGDMMDIVVWEDGVSVIDRNLYYYQAIHQESDVVPEIVDCIRSMCKLQDGAASSMAKTNATLGLKG